MVHKNSIARSADLRLMRRCYRCSGSATSTSPRLVPTSLPGPFCCAKQSASPECSTRSTIFNCRSNFDCSSSFISEAWLSREFGPAVAQDRSNAARCRCSSVVHPISATECQVHGSNFGSHHRFDACRSRYARLFGQRCIQQQQLFGVSMDTDAMVSSRETDRLYACCCYQY